MSGVNPTRGPLKVVGTLAPLALVLFFVAVLGWWTHGLKAFTSYSAALIEAGPLPRQAPALRYVDAAGKVEDAARAQPRFRLVNFFYARCPEACPLAMGRIHRIQAALGDLVPGQVRIMSLSFDDDSPEQIQQMWVAHGEPASWTMGVLVDPHHDELLRRLGVLVIRRRDGLINHSLDLFVIDSEGQVRAVFSPDDPPEFVAHTIRALT
jgi:protein SCO1/2